MRALVWTAPGRQEVRDVPAAVPASDDVLIRPALVGVCGSDVTAHKGRMGTTRPGSIRGHEFGGVVLQDTAGIVAGTRVAVDPVVTCGACAACADARDTHCVRTEIIGVHRPGGFAEAVAVPRRQVHAIPDELTWEEAATAEPLANAVHMAEIGLAAAPASALVIGAGSIGMHIVRVLTERSLPRIDVVEARASRVPLVRAAGAGTVHGDVADVEAGAYGVVFDVVGSAATRRAALRSAARGGTVVLVGLDEDETAVSWHDVVRRELNLRGAQAFGRRDYAAALTLLQNGKVRPELSRVVPLEEAPSLFDDLAAGRASFEGKHFIAV